MRAALLHKIKEPLKLEDIPKPKIKPNEVLVKVKACGICHSDLHFIDGILRVGKLPIILGHEAAGIVAKVGEDVKGFSEGEHVIIHFYISCGTCHYCRNGQENLCDKVVRFGMDVNGAFAEYAKVPARNLIKLPVEVKFEEGALLGCALGTSYHALKDTGKLKEDETIAIYGIGGLGMSAVQIAKLCGAHTIAVDIVDEKLNIAKKLGAEITINAKNKDPVKTIRDLTNGEGADLSVEFIGLPETITQALNSTRKRGRCVLVGFSALNVSVNTNDIIIRELTIRGSRGMSRTNLIELTRLVKAKKLDLAPLVTKIIPLEKINVGIDILRSKAAVRVVVKV